MGPGRTGVKGVIKDRNEAQTMARTKRAQDIEAMNQAMEKASLGGLTWGEEEQLRLAEKAREEERSTSTSARTMFSKGRFGHLREVGERGFVQAIESEDRNVWVVVHIYDPVRQAFYLYIVILMVYASPVTRPLRCSRRKPRSSC